MTTTIAVHRVRCRRCDHEWRPRAPAMPLQCPMCRSGLLEAVEAPPPPSFRCQRCDHHWVSRLADGAKPVLCPRCHTRLWARATGAARGTLSSP